MKGINDLELLKIIVPTTEKYEKIKKRRLKKSYIKCLYKMRGILFFVVDDKNQLLFKVTKSLYPFQEKYQICDPFDNKLGQLVYGGKDPYHYDVTFENSIFTVNFEKNEEGVSFDLFPLNISLKGDTIATSFKVIATNKEKEYAEVNYYSRGNKGLTYEINWNSTANRNEILLAIIVTKLIQFHTMD